MGDFFDNIGEEAFGEIYDEGYTDAEEELSDEGYSDLTEKEAFDTYDLAISLGLGEEIGLEEAEFLKARDEERKLARENEKTEETVRSLRSRHTEQIGFTPGKKGNISKVTGKYKCPYEQWMMDIATGRKTIKDPMDINIFEEEF